MRRSGARPSRDNTQHLSASSRFAVTLNIAESAGRVAHAEKAHFIAIARGGAMECGASVEVLLSSGIAPIGLCREARVLLIRVTQMLTRLQARCRAKVGLD